MTSAPLVEMRDITKAFGGVHGDGRGLEHRCAPDMHANAVPGRFDVLALDHLTETAATWRRKWSKSGVVARGSLAASS